MANFNAFKITNAGAALETRAQTGTPINFSKFVVGDGTYTGSVDVLTNLVHPIMTLPVSRLKSQLGTDTKLIIGFDLSSANVSTGFYLREIGIYATNPDGGNDILVFYGNSGNTADYIEPSSSATMTEKIIDIEMYISNASSITATIDSSLVYATQADVNELSTTVNGKAPNLHSSSATTYGVGTTGLYGHVKLANNLTTSSYNNGVALSAYQGYLLNNNKAPNNHASANTTYGIGTSSLYGHAKIKNNLTTSSYVDGEALSAYQGYLLNQNKQNNISAGNGIIFSDNQVAANFGNEAATVCEGNDPRLSDARNPLFHASTNITYGVGTTSLFGHVKLANDLTNSSYSNGVALSAYQGYLLNNKFANYLPLAGGTLTGLLTANGGIKGDVTGNVTGNVTGSSGSCIGNAATATKLASSKTINGTNFDGSGNITTTKWGTSRVLALTGAVTGSASVDGSGNVSISTTQANMAVLTGTLTVPKNDSASTSFLSYPTGGFNKDNCVVVSLAIKTAGNFWEYDNWNDTQYGPKVTLSSNGVQLTVKNNNTTSSITYTYQIVLMKIS